MPSVSKLQKRLRKKRKFSFILSYILVFIGSGLMVFGVLSFYNARILSFTSTPQSSTTNVQTINREDELPIHLTIPSINIDLPIESGSIKDGVWQISYENATFLDSSAEPGTGGNIVIYGHNKKKIFGNLPYITKGARITLTAKNGKTFDYEVESKIYVKPDRVDLVSPLDHEILTIYTCW